MTLEKKFEEMHFPIGELTVSHDIWEPATRQYESVLNGILATKLRDHDSYLTLGNKSYDAEKTITTLEFIKANTKLAYKQMKERMQMIATNPQGIERYIGKGSSEIAEDFSTERFVPSNIEAERTLLKYVALNAIATATLDIILQKPFEKGEEVESLEFNPLERGKFWKQFYSMVRTHAGSEDINRVMTHYFSLGTPPARYVKEAHRRLREGLAD